MAYSCLRTLPVVLLVLVSFCRELPAQTGYRANDVVTFSDFRSLNGGEVTPTEVLFVTDNGLFRLDRYTRKPLDPWVYGPGFGKMLPLDGEVVIWHWMSSSLWIARKNQLIYLRLITQKWEALQYTFEGNITSLGESDRHIWVEVGDQLHKVSTLHFRYDGTADRGDSKVRWRGKRDLPPEELTFWLSSPLDVTLDKLTLDIIDARHNRFSPAFFIDDYNQARIYIGYPGYGIGILRKDRRAMDLVQVGLAGKDVRAIAVNSLGDLWVGGNNKGNTDGVNSLSRAVTGMWEHYGYPQVDGMVSHSAFDVVADGSETYFATDKGLVYRTVYKGNWRSFKEIDGMTNLPLRAIERIGKTLFTGGDRGLLLFPDPLGYIVSPDEPTASDLVTSDMATDGDTIWVTGFQGVWKCSPSIGWEVVRGDDQLSQMPPRCVTIDPNNLWIGVQGGVRRLNRQTGEWSSYLSAGILNNNNPISLAGNDSLLWIGTELGLYGANIRTGSTHVWNRDKGIPDLRIQRLLLEADTLWIGTPSGLTRFLWNRPERDMW